MYGKIKPPAFFKGFNTGLDWKLVQRGRLSLTRQSFSSASLLPNIDTAPIMSPTASAPADSPDDASLAALANPPVVVIYGSAIAAPINLLAVLYAPAAAPIAVDVALRVDVRLWP